MSPSRCGDQFLPLTLRAHVASMCHRSSLHGDGVLVSILFHLSASCPDDAASLWFVVAAAAYFLQPRLREGMASARDDGASHPSRHDQYRLNVLWSVVFLAASSSNAV